VTSRTLVSIYEVDQSGDTGAQVGTGSLIEMRLVLVHPPLSRDLARGGVNPPPRLRLAVGSLDAETSVVEVIDADDVAVIVAPDDEPLVGLKLVRPARSAVNELMPAGEADRTALVAAARRHVAEVAALGGAVPPPAGRLDFPDGRPNFPDGPPNFPDGPPNFPDGPNPIENVICAWFPQVCLPGGPGDDRRPLDRG
jgi:hypothetical protein